MANFPTNLQENRSNISWDILATGRHTERGGGGNNHDKNQEQQLHDEGGEVDHIDYDND